MLIQKHQAQWENNFISIKEVILSQFQNSGLFLEHVGSTAVKNLAAKAIIDIDIVHNKNLSFSHINEGLEKLGYNHIGNLNIEEREVFKRENRKEDHPILDTIKHHLYVCPIDSLELHRHLIFRDYLIQSTAARNEYEKLKLKIAEQALQDKEAYSILKEIMAKDFIESILKKAKTK